MVKGQIHRVKLGKIEGNFTLAKAYAIKRLLATRPWLEKIKLREVTSDDCRKWAKEFSARYAVTVYNTSVSVRREAFGVGIEAGAITINPVIGFNPDRPAVVMLKPKRQQVLMPNAEQWAAMVREANRGVGPQGHDAALLMRLLAYTGCRVGEGAALTWQDVDFANHIIFVNKQWLKLPGGWVLKAPKGGGDVIGEDKSRIVPLVRVLKNLLLAERALRADEPPTAQIARVRCCSVTLKRCCAKVGIPPLSQHKLRHFFTTICLENPLATAKAIGQALGHAHGGKLVSERYGHRRLAMVQKIARTTTFGPVEQHLSRQDISCHRCGH